MTDYLEAHTDHQRAAARQRHTEALRPHRRQTASMAAYIAGLPDRAERNRALAVVRELAPDLAEAVAGEVRTQFDLRKARRGSA